MPELTGPLSWPGPRDAVLLVVLAIGCTLLPFALSFVALRHISAFSAQLALNLEPVYAIVLAIVLLGEQRELGAVLRGRRDHPRGRARAAALRPAARGRRAYRPLEARLTLLLRGALV